MRPPTFVRRSLVRLATGGALAIAAVWLGGLALELVRFGRDEAAALSRVEGAVGTEVAGLESRLQQAIEVAAIDAESVRLAEQGDTGQQRHLFDRVSLAGSLGLPSVSVTVYSSTNTPIAWTGRPGELPDMRIAGPDALFLAPAAQGLRMVRIHPLTAAQDASRRVGTLALEVLLASNDGLEGVDGYVLSTPLVPVRVRPPFEGGSVSKADEFLVRDVSGSPLAAIGIPDSAIEGARLALRDRVRAAILVVLAVLLLLATGPLLDWRRLSRSWTVGALVTLAIGAFIVMARVVIGRAIADPGIVGSPLLEDATGVGAWFFRSAVHFLVSSLFLAALVGLAASSLELWRIARRGRGAIAIDTPQRAVAFILCQVAAGALVTALIAGYVAFLRLGVASVPADVLHFELRPWDWRRLAIVIGLVVLNATVVTVAVVLLRAALARWAHRVAPAGVRVLTIAAWLTAPAVVAGLHLAERWAPAAPTWVALLFAIVVAWRIGHVRAMLRNASQAVRLMAAVLALVLPSLAFYPSLLDAATRARRSLIETRFAPEVLDQRRNLQRNLSDALASIDRVEGIADLVRAADPSPQGAPPSDAAFLIWSATPLAQQRLTSSVELYNAAGTLVSRFALKLPDISGAQVTIESGCTWDIFEEVSPFFAEERRLLHAGRSLCSKGGDGRVRRHGSVVVHVMLDFTNLSFVSARSPYVALLATGPQGPPPGIRPPVNFAVYGWSRKVLFASPSAAWPIDDESFARTATGRDSFWVPIVQGGRRAEAYVLNDRAGIYVLSSWTETPIGHLVVMAELVTLAFLTFLIAVVGGMLFRTVAARTPTSGRALLREVRASFYRKLFLAFVAATVVPVVALAFVTRAYFAQLMFADIEMEATRTASVASRVVEDFGSLQVRGLAALPIIDDNVVVWLSRVIAGDVNIFDGPSLLASSVRNLFASGLLPTRTPGDMYRAILIDGRPSFVGRESIGGVEYLVAASPVRVQDRNAILTVPLTSRQQEIEGQIAELDRRVLLAALLFIMLGAGIGHSMAERIADPVNRLMRATRRVAQGDLDAHVLATSSDELSRLVNAFNGMAEDLRRQRGELERTNRLAAWAEMARQVAHDIKNPLTPIQLNAEHLQRVHVDRGRPLGTLVDDCVASILGQVRLLRQIASEFSSFASSPQPKPRTVDLGGVIRGILDPYAAGLAGRVSLLVDIPGDLPPVHVDPLLVGRAFTNVIENALHAMPGGGRLTISARRSDDRSQVILEVADTGVGMDGEALERIFEPYFSTKASGTGLGLTIAKRNIEANSGNVSVRSEPGGGTTVRIGLPTTVSVEFARPD